MEESKGKLKGFGMPEWEHFLATDPSKHYIGASDLFQEFIDRSRSGGRRRPWKERPTV